MDLSRDEQSLAAEQTVGQFALVAYIPAALAQFLDDLRLELTPGSKPRAHVTVLPPRPVHSDLKLSIQEMQEQLRDAAPFRVALGEIETFAASHVVYLSIAQGGEELRRLYARLNHGCVKYAEAFPYHPHITIAQNIQPDEVNPMVAIARERWAGWTGPRSFDVPALTFVQHVALSVWADIATLPLGVEVVTGRRG